MKRSIYTKLLAKMIGLNQSLIEESAIKNCHVPGLHSFILCKSPKIRLYIADEKCVLRQPFDVSDPYLTIHPHKHNDVFIPLTKTQIVHHLYRKTVEENENTIGFNINYYKRIDDGPSSGLILGSDYLDYIESKPMVFLKSHELHTVSILGNAKCAWLVMEIGTDEGFQPISYGGKQISPECYQTFDNPIEYILNFFNLNLTQELTNESN